jgi:ribonuclease P protein component
MLSRTARLNRLEFTTCFTRGRRLHSPHLSVVVYTQDTFKASVVVSKKVAKKAHDRNRLRRRVYACIQAHAPQRGWFVFVVKPAATKLTKQQFKTVLGEEIAQVLKNE